MSAEAAEPIYVKSPEIDANGRVTLRYFAPEAKAVAAVSNTKALDRPLIKGERGVWSLTTEPLAADTYEYHFDVDGAQVVDPVNRHVKGWMWCENLINVPGKPLAKQQLQSVPHGQVHIHWYDSPRLNQTRRVFVYTPPGYAESCERSSDQSNEKYPVLYLFHGCGDDESAWTTVGQVQHLADNLLAEGKAKPMVIVMPFGHDDLPDSPDFDSYDCLRNFAPVGDEFFNGVVPFAESTYRIRQDAVGRALAGLSMGGGQALRIGLTNPEKFYWVAGFSSAIKEHEVQKAIEPKLAAIKAQQSWLWLGCGKDDFLFQDTVEFDKWLDEKQVKHTTKFDDGNHNWRTWRGYFAEVMPKLFRN